MNVTYHAKQKYIQIMSKDGIAIDLDRAEKDILRLLEEAKEEKDNSGLIKRYIENEFEEAKYYVIGLWRIVLVNETIVTIEENRFKFAGPGYISKSVLTRNSKRERQKKKKKKYKNGNGEVNNKKKKSRKKRIIK